MAIEAQESQDSSFLQGNKDNKGFRVFLNIMMSWDPVERKMIEAPSEFEEDQDRDHCSALLDPMVQQMPQDPTVLQENKETRELQTFQEE